MKIQLPASLRESGQSGLLDVGVPPWERCVRSSTSSKVAIRW